MRLPMLAIVMLACTLLPAATPTASGGEAYYRSKAQWRAAQRPWHGRYYHTAWGQPVALVVPPTAELQSDYRWGVPSLEVNRIDHQFQRGYPGYGVARTPFMATPQWPSDTRQYGVYYIRGPW